MWYTVGKYVVMTGSRSEEPGKWFADWTISEIQEDGALRSITHGRGKPLSEQPMDAAEGAVPLGVEEARRLQGDMTLPFTPYRPTMGK
jgi:hypothetical protein